MTMVPRTGPLSASSALATTSWYQRGKFSDWDVRTGVRGHSSDRKRSEDALEASSFLACPLLCSNAPFELGEVFGGAWAGSPRFCFQRTATGTTETRHGRGR